MIYFQNTEFIRSAAGREGFPADGLSQVVFAGRSNVGKSSVINCLCGRKKLARISSTPGKTANINLYLVDKSFWLADLPGYGFAKVNKQEKARWGALMETYFKESECIRLGVMIVDIRHAPTDDDLAMKEYFRKRGLPFVVVANKSDKLSKTGRPECLQAVREALEAPDALMFSARTGEGRQELMNKILSAVLP